MVATIDEDRIDVAENLRADVGLLERPQIHGRVHLHRNVAGDHLGDHDRGGQPGLGGTARLGLAATHGHQRYENGKMAGG